MAGYVRKDTANNIADGNVINASDFDNEFDGVQDAFNSSTGHVHDGTTGNGSPISSLGPTQDVVVSATAVTPKTNNIVDVGSAALKFKNLHLAGTAAIGGTLDVTGVTTLTAQPVLSSLTASQAVFTNGTKGLVSNAITGTGDVVMSTSPTLVTPALGTPSALVGTNITGTASGLTAGNVTTNANLTGAVTSVGNATSLGSFTSAALLDALTDETGTGSAVFATSPTLVTPALGTPSALVGTNITGTATSFNINGTVGATTAAAGTFTTVNATTVDTTNVEVTNIKAKDGTASATIADSTGVITIGSSVLTTADINGGTIDNTAIGGATPAAGSFSSLTDSGNLNFTGTGNRITGDFSNATVANRVLLQSSTTNGNTIVAAIPNGTSVSAAIWAMNNSDPTNAGRARMTASSTEISLISDYNGTGTYLPMTFYTGGSERVKVDTSGNVGIGTSSPSSKLAVLGSDGTGFTGVTSTNSNGNVGIAGVQFGSDPTYVKAAIGLLRSNPNGVGSLVFYNDSNTDAANWSTADEKMRIDQSGNVGIGTSSPTAKLHVVGAELLTSTSAETKFTINNTGTGGVEYWIGSTNNSSGAVGGGRLAFYDQTANAIRMAINSSGNVGVGTSSPRTKFVSVNGTDNATGGSDPSGAAGSFVGATGTANQSTLSIESNDTVAANTGGSIGLGGRYNSTSWAQWAKIGALKDNATSGEFGGSLAFYTRANGGSNTEKIRIDSSGNVGVGTSSPSTYANGFAPVLVTGTGNNFATVQARTDGPASYANGVSYGGSYSTNPINGARIFIGAAGGAGQQGGIFFLTKNTDDNTNQPTERMRIDASGTFFVGKTSTALTTAGVGIESSGVIGIGVGSVTSAMFINRQSDDGTLIQFRQANAEEGSISVSGTTVSYNGGHLSRWAQTTTAKDDSLVKGTVLSNLDSMNVYTDADGNPVDNEQLNKVKVSDVDGDVNVAGVFVNWSYDEAHLVDEINMAMTGDMIIRIAQGTTVARGDLLMSAGDGTAKPQGDDIVRSKTIAKVTSTHVTCTYADGSYCVPCVLMAC